MNTVQVLRLPEPEQSWDEAADWDETREAFLNAIDGLQRDEVERALRQSHRLGAGLRAWLNRITTGVSVLPGRVPREVIEVYLQYPGAVPLHDCESCGLGVPVIPSRDYGYEGEPERAFFPRCPNCGGRTGWYLFWSSERQARRKPR